MKKEHSMKFIDSKDQQTDYASGERTGGQKLITTSEPADKVALTSARAARRLF